MRTGPLLLHAVALAACATPRDRLERDDLTPVPRTAAAAEETAAERRPPGVLPSAETSSAAALLADVRKRGAAELSDCIRLAEATSEDLLSGDEDRLQEALRRDLALAGVLPSVSFTAAAFVQDRVPGETGSNSFSAAADRETWAITVRQPIFKGFAEFAAIRAANNSAAAREASIDVMRAGLSRSVARAFFGVLESDAEVRALEESEKADSRRVDEMRARQENGLARRSEVLLLESQLLSTETDLRRARARRDDVRVTLDQLVGVELGVPLSDTELPQGPVPDRKAALTEAIGARPELRAAQLSAAAAEASVDVARAGYWPVVAAVGNWYLGRRNATAFAEATDWDALLTLEFPIYDGSATSTRERTAKSDVRKARLAESSALREVVSDVEGALARIAHDDDLLATAERNVKIATENLSLLEQEFANGIATNLEVLTAQNNLQESRLSLERQRLVSRLDRVDLALALGRKEMRR
jgi:outer membrane protein TolC